MKKDLNYYLNNTDEMPTDPKEIERLASEHMQAAIEVSASDLDIDRFVEPEEVKDEKDSESSDAETKEEPVAEPEPEKVEEKPVGVLAKDGKNTIPYAVLSSARERAETAERLVAEQAAELERLKSGKTEPVVEAELLSDEELDALEVDSPTLAKVLRAQQQTIKSLETTVQSLAERSQNQIEVEQQEAKSEVQTAIDANPELAGWQAAEDRTLWNEASRLDKALRESPTYADVPFEERFAKVVELTKAAFGVEEPKPEPSQADIKAAADAKLAATAKKVVPKSLSDIPGGAPPAVDEQQRLEQMSSVELGNKFLGMTPDQMQTYLESM